jgi:hypothetical protein
VTDRYAVIGNPVAHSKSPFIHAEFARQTGQDLVYERILAPLEGFRAAVANFRAEGGKGLNVTLPFKLEAFQIANERGPRAQDAAAVNTLKFEGATVYGENTDGVGLVSDIQTNLGFSLEGRHVLLMGAGGAAQGALGPLLEAQPARLVVDVVPTAPIPGQYIVLFKPGTPNVAALAHAMFAANPKKLKYIYSSVANGFAAELDDTLHASLHGNPNVITIEQDQTVTAVSTIETSAPWGVDRLDQRGLPLDNSRLVVLSACDTGRAEATHANEIIGLVRALIYAGAGALVLSYWEVDSDATALWMQTFYQAALTRPIAEAARLALTRVKSDPAYSHPYYWAAFAMVGR